MLGGPAERLLMQKRKMGPDGPEVSAIGIGAMSFAGVYGPTD